VAIQQVTMWQQRFFQTLNPCRSDISYSRRMFYLSPEGNSNFAEYSSEPHPNPPNPTRAPTSTLFTFRFWINGECIVAILCGKFVWMWSVCGESSKWCVRERLVCVGGRGHCAQKGGQKKLFLVGCQLGNTAR
jgi:hypothetical protein